MSAELTQSSSKADRGLEQALRYAASRGVILVVAAGNAGTLGGSAIVRHPWSIPVVASDLRGTPLSASNIGASIGRKGLCAPGDRITSSGVDGKACTFTGTSAAAPFVTGTIALLWSLFPRANADHIKLAVTQCGVRRLPTVVPPLLNAWAAYEAMKYNLGDH